MAESAVIASIIGLSSVGTKLSKTLYQIGHKTVTANHNINRIATNVVLFTSMLKHMSSTLEDLRSPHTTEALDTVEQLVKEGESVFKDITRLIITATKHDECDGSSPVSANGHKRRLSNLQRATWYFEQPKVDCILVQLDYLKTSLSVVTQTLHLATTSANLRSSQHEERIEEERMHLETLIMAQQLSVVVMNGVQESSTLIATQESPSLRKESSDGFVVVPIRRNLTLDSDFGTSMIKLNGGPLRFLNEGFAPGQVAATPALIHQLLGRWTRHDAYRDLHQLAIEDGVHQLDIEDPSSTLSLIEHTAQVPVVDRTTPDLRLHLVDSLSPPKNISTESSNRWLDPRYPTSSKKENSFPESPTSFIHADMPSPPPQYSSPRDMSPMLLRTVSNPESDGQQIKLQTFHDQHALQVVPQNSNNDFGPHQGVPSQGPPSPGSASTLAYYVSRSSSLNTPSAPMAIPTGANTNYRAPFVSSRSTCSSDSESDASLHARSMPRRRKSNRSDASEYDVTKRHDDNAMGQGLNIPWTIRISKQRYFDFCDSEVVGPCTPYPPREDMSRVYCHDNATTEISKRWVAEEAILEARLGYSETPEQWRIMRPLHFPEIEALVTRTIDIYRLKTGHTQRTRTAPSSTPMPRSAPLPPAPIQQNPRAASAHFTPPRESRDAARSYDLTSRSYDPDMRGPPRPQPRPRSRDEQRDRDTSKQRHSHRSEREKERDRKERDKERRKRHTSMAGTMAKIGGLAALLEGLDGAF